MSHGGGGRGDRSSGPAGPGGAQRRDPVVQFAVEGHGRDGSEGLSDTARPGDSRPSSSATDPRATEAGRSATKLTEQLLYPWPGADPVMGTTTSLQEVPFEELAWRLGSHQKAREEIRRRHKQTAAEEAARGGYKRAPRRISNTQGALTDDGEIIVPVVAPAPFLVLPSSLDRAGEEAAARLLQYTKDNTPGAHAASPFLRAYQSPKAVGGVWVRGTEESTATGQSLPRDDAPLLDARGVPVATITPGPRPGTRTSVKKVVQAFTQKTPSGRASGAIPIEGPIFVSQATLGLSLMSGIGPTMKLYSSFNDPGPRKRKPKFGSTIEWSPDEIVQRQAPVTKWTLPGIEKDVRALLHDRTLHDMHGALVSTHGLLSGAEAARLAALGAGKWPEPLGRIAVKNDFVEIDGDPPPPKFLITQFKRSILFRIAICLSAVDLVPLYTTCPILRTAIRMSVNVACRLLYSLPGRPAGVWGVDARDDVSAKVTVEPAVIPVWNSLQWPHLRILRLVELQQLALRERTTPAALPPPGSLLSHVTLTKEYLFIAKPPVITDTGQLLTKESHKAPLIPMLQLDRETDGFMAASLGADHACVLAGKTLWVWGRHTEGQLGLHPWQLAGATAGTMGPCVMEAPQALAYITCGGSHSMAVSEEGDLFVWGRGDAGQLGVEELLRGRKKVPGVTLRPSMAGSAGGSVAGVTTNRSSRQGSSVVSGTGGEDGGSHVPGSRGRRGPRSDTQGTMIDGSLSVAEPLAGTGALAPISTRAAPLWVPDPTVRRLTVPKGGRRGLGADAGVDGAGAGAGNALPDSDRTSVDEFGAWFGLEDIRGGGGSATGGSVASVPGSVLSGSVTGSMRRGTTSTVSAGSIAQGSNRAGGGSTQGGRSGSPTSGVSFSTYSSPSVVPARVWASTASTATATQGMESSMAMGSLIDGTGGASGIGAPFRIRAPLLVGSVRQVAAGGAHSLLVTTGGVVYSCGRGRHGQLGTGRLENVEKWTRVETITEPAVQVTCGWRHSVVLLTSGVVAFGCSSRGELGTGALGDAPLSLANPTPARVLIPEGLMPIHISTGARHSLALCRVWTRPVDPGPGLRYVPPPQPVPEAPATTGKSKGRGGRRGVGLSNASGMGTSVTGGSTSLYGTSLGSQIGGGTSLVTASPVPGSPSLAGAGSSVVGGLASPSPTRGLGGSSVLDGSSVFTDGAAGGGSNSMFGGSVLGAGSLAGSVDTSPSKGTLRSKRGQAVSLPPVEPPPPPLSKDLFVVSWGFGVATGRTDKDMTMGGTLDLNPPHLPAIVQLPSLEAGDQACQVSAGRSHSLVLTQRGVLFGFGTNDHWELGDPGAMFPSPAPSPLPHRVPGLWGVPRGDSTTPGGAGFSGGAPHSDRDPPALGLGTLSGREHYEGPDGTPRRRYAGLDSSREHSQPPLLLPLHDDTRLAPAEFRGTGGSEVGSALPMSTARHSYDIPLDVDYVGSVSRQGTPQPDLPRVVRVLVGRDTSKCEPIRLASAGNRSSVVITASREVWALGQHPVGPGVQHDLVPAGRRSASGTGNSTGGASRPRGPVCLGVV